ncbi:MAG: ATP-binding cassette domain-containing protein [Ignavibacteria bacterium CHB3]|nr:ATP-binding cassette domain-containing protein [Ignavibacteria bacterium CHB3]
MHSNHFYITDEFGNEFHEVHKEKIYKIDTFFKLADKAGLSIDACYDCFTFDDVKRKSLRRKIGVIFQDFKLLPDRNVYQNLAYVLKVTGVPSTDAKRKINEVLTEVGLSHKRLNKPGELSGGEQQRIAIARAIINDPVLILADEPTGNLDPDTSSEILALLKKINKRGTSVLVATHNYEIVKKANERVIKLEDGRALKAVIKPKSELQQ